MLNSIRNVKFIQMQTLSNVYAVFVLFFMKRWPKNKSLYDTILVLLNFFCPWKSGWIDRLIHWLSKSIFLKKRKKKVTSSHAMVSKIQAQSAFLNWKAPSFHYTIGIVTTGQCHGSATRWRSCNHARPFSFVPLLSFTKLEHFGWPLRLWQIEDFYIVQS